MPISRRDGTTHPATARSLLLLGFLVAVLATYWPIAAGLVGQWATDDNHSHGFLIVPLALYFAWQRRAALAAAPLRPARVRFVVVLASLATLVAGVANAEYSGSYENIR